MLEARHLSKRFFGVTVVHDVNLVVRVGEVVGYLGPNGSGKTTTVRMLTGLLEPTGAQSSLMDAILARIPSDSEDVLDTYRKNRTSIPFCQVASTLSWLGDCGRFLLRLWSGKSPRSRSCSA